VTGTSSSSSGFRHPHGHGIKLETKLDKALERIAELEKGVK
jgi:hypothetical protein